MRLENTVRPNGRDVAIISCFCLDKDGREVPTASPTVYFSANELGQVLSTGSDICDHTPLLSPVRRMRAGRISVAVRVKDRVGDLKILATSDGLDDAVLTISLK